MTLGDSTFDEIFPLSKGGKKAKPSGGCPGGFRKVEWTTPGAARRPFVKEEYGSRWQWIRTEFLVYFILRKRW